MDNFSTSGLPNITGGTDNNIETKIVTAVQQAINPISRGNSEWIGVSTPLKQSGYVSEPVWDTPNTVKIEWDTPNAPTRAIETPSVVKHSDLEGLRTLLEDQNTPLVDDTVEDTNKRLLRAMETLEQNTEKEQKTIDLREAPDGTESDPLFVRMNNADDMVDDIVGGIDKNDKKREKSQFSIIDLLMTACAGITALKLFMPNVTNLISKGFAALGSKLWDGAKSLFGFDKPKDAPKDGPKDKSKDKPKEKPKETPKDKSKDAPKEKPKEQAKPDAKEKPKDAPKEKVKEPPTRTNSTAEKPVPKELPKEQAKPDVKDAPKEKPTRMNSAKASDALKAGSKYGKLVTKGFAPVNLAMGAFDVVRTESDDTLTREEKNIEHAGTVGGWAGAAVGAKIGAMAGGAGGALIGSIVPGAGTAIGGGIGAVVGGIGLGIVGALLGEEAAKSLAKKIYDMDGEKPAETPKEAPEKPTEVLTSQADAGHATASEMQQRALETQMDAEAAAILQEIETNSAVVNNTRTQTIINNNTNTTQTRQILTVNPDANAIHGNAR